jgi:hypothetical protein
VDAAGPVRLRVTVASDLTDDNWSGLVRVVPPAGWRAEPATWPVALPPGGHAELPVAVHPAADAVAGDHLVEVLIAGPGAAAVVADGDFRAHQVALSSTVDSAPAVRDLVTVTVPGAYPGAVGPGEVAVTLEPPALSVRPGERAVLRARLANRYRSPVDVHGWLLGPVETWPLTPRPVVTGRVGPDAAQTLEFPVAVPADARPGSWWLLVKYAYADRIGYTESVRLTVEAPRR